MTEIDVLVDTERRALLAVLEQLEDGEWETPSLCEGWSVRDAVVHLLMPYELSVPGFLGRLATARFRFDTMADRWARLDQRSPVEVVEALRATARRRFGIPGAPREAPLSHLVIHLEDIYRPLGVTDRCRSGSAKVVLGQMTGPRFRSSLPPGLLDGLALSATDVAWTFGRGAPVRGSSSALITTLAGRAVALDELSGSGAELVRERLMRRGGRAADGPVSSAPSGGHPEQRLSPWRARSGEDDRRASPPPRWVQGHAHGVETDGHMCDRRRGALHDRRDENGSPCTCSSGSADGLG